MDWNHFNDSFNQLDLFIKFGSDIMFRMQWL